MAFGNITTLYLPTTANAGASQWGTDVRKLLDAADAASDALTKTNHGTGASVVRTFDPYTTTNADLDQSLYGWAITPTDMNSVAGALRFYPAGNHVATIRVGHTAATAKSANFSLTVYRVGPAPTRTRTLLGTANSGTVSIPGLAGELTVTITVALPEIVFAVDETIQYSFEVGAAGTALTGDIITLFTGTQSAVVGQIATPKLGVLADTTGTADGSSTAQALMTTVLGTTGSAEGSSEALGLLSAMAATTGEAAGSSEALALMSAVAGTTGTAEGSSQALALMSVVLGTTGTASACEGGGTTNRIVYVPVED